MGMMEKIYDRKFRQDRKTYCFDFLQRPGLNADKDWPTPYEATTAIAQEVVNMDFEVSGTNMTSALCTACAGGGITLTTAGATNDQALIGAHTNTSMTALNGDLFKSNYEPSFEALIKTHTAITQQTFIAGFKLTSAPAIATDNDQACFRFSNTTVATAWTFISSRSGTDTTTTVRAEAAGVTVLSTIYRLRIDVLSDRTVLASIGTGITGALKEISLAPLAALTTNISLLPFLGIQNLNTGATAFSLMRLELGHKIR